MASSVSIVASCAWIGARRGSPGGSGPVSVYEFASAPTVCYTECYAGGRIVEAPAEVVELVTVISMLRASALPRRESRELIRQIRSEIDDQ